VHRRRLAYLTVAVSALVAVGCGDDDAGSSDEEQVEQVGNAWADPFGRGDEAMCEHLHPDLGGASSCDAYLEGALTGGTDLQRTFEGATVESVEVDGETAVAEFSNDNRVVFRQDAEGAWKVLEPPQVSESGSEEVIQPG
jgi:hypothetical protein